MQGNILKRDCHKMRAGLLLILLFFSYSLADAAVYYSRANGNWNSPSSWSTVACGGAAAATFPGAADDVIICAGNTITVTADASARTLEVRGIIITKDAITLTVEGNVTVQGSGELYLTGSASCNANEESTVIIKGNYTNYGISCFNKSWVVIAGDVNSPSASGIQNNGYLVVGGNATGVINQTGGQSVYAANPYATVTLTGTTPVLSAPTSPAGLVDIVNAIIFGGTCGFTINGPANVTACSSGPVDFIIISTTATAPTYQWEVNSGYGWVPLGNAGVYSGVTTPTLHISDAAGLNGYIYRCKITSAGCSKYSFAGTLTVTATPPPTAPSVGTITQPTCATATGSVVLSGLPAGSWTINPGAITGNTATTTISGLPTGTHNFTVKNSVGCLSVASSNVVIATQPTPPASATFSITQPTCAVSTATITITSPVAGYEYNIDGGAYQVSTTFNSVPTGNHSIVVRRISDNTCMSAAVTATIASQPTVPASATFNIIQPTCAVATGTITITAPVTGYEYKLDAGAYQASATFNNVAAGSHTILVRRTSDNTCVSAGVTANVLPQPTPPSSATFSIIQPTCTVSTGTITITDPLGLYDYSIDGGTYQSSATFSNVAAGGHTILVRRTSDNTCISSPVTATVNTQPATPASPSPGTITQPTCSTATGSVVLSGLPAGSWTINPGGIAGSGTTATISGLATGTHSFTVTNAAGCTSASSSNVIIGTQPATPAAPSVGTITQPDCGTATGSVVLSGLPSGTWTINPGGITGNTTTTTISSLASGTYSFTVTNAAGCASAASANVVINAQPSTPTAPVIGTITHATCASGTGSVALSGLPAGNWTINPGGIAGNTATTTITGLAPGTRNFTVTNAAGCISPVSADAVINAAAGAPAAATFTIVQPACTVSTGTITITGPLTGYEYNLDGGSYQSSTTFSSVAPGNHTILVRRTSDNTCISAGATATVNAQPATPTAPVVGTITQPTCASSTGSVVLSGLPSGNWTINPGGITGSTLSATISGLSSGTHNFTVTNDVGCTSPLSGNVVLSSPPGAPSAPIIGTITQPTCALGTGSVELSGLPAGNWTINPGGITGNTATKTISGLAPATHNFTVTNSLGCISSFSADVVIIPAAGAPASAVFTIVQPTCTVSTGTITITAPLTGYEYKLDGGAYQSSTTFSGVATGDHTILVRRTPDNTCISAGVTATVNAQPVTPTAPVVGTITQPTCASSTGSVVLSGLPAGNWTIEPGTITGNTATTTISGLSAGTHNFTVTNDAGCTSPLSGNVVLSSSPGAPSAPVIGAITQPTCTLGSGSVVLSGLPAVSWTIYPGGITGTTASTTISGLAPGTHNFTVANSLGCISAVSADVVIDAQPVTPSAPVIGTITQPTCATPTGSVDVSGLPAGNWTINPGGIAGSTSTTTVSGLAPGTRTFTVINEAGCTSAPSASVVISAAAGSPTVATYTIVQPTCTVSTGTITITGPLTGYEYNLDGGAFQSTTTFSSVAPGDHTILVRRTSDNTCISAGVTATINAQPSAPAPPVVGTITQPTCATPTGSVVLSGLPAGSWTIQPGTLTGNTATTTISGLSAGTHNFTVTNSSGCTSIASADVVINAAAGAPAAPSFTVIQPSCTVSTGTITVTAPAGLFDYSIDGVYQGSATFSNVPTGDHTIIIRRSSDNTCVSSPVTATVSTQPATPAAPAVGTITQPTCSSSTGSVVLSGLPAGSWTINPGAIAGNTATATISGLATGTYNFTVTNAAGCISAASVSVIINSQPAAPASASFNIIQPTCASSTGTINITGPAGAYEYNLDGGIYQSTTTFSSVATGTHTILVRRISDNTCVSSSATATINPQPSAPAAATFTVTQPTCTVSTGTIIITAPTGAYEYNLDAGVFQGTTTFNNVAPGNHTILVRRTTDNTCVSSVTASVSAQPLTPASPSTGTITQPTCALSTGSVVLSGLPSGNWTINPGTITGNTTTTTISGLAAGTYNFTVTNDAGCTSPASGNVVINTQPATPSAPVIGTITQPTCAIATASVVLSGLPAGNWTINPGAITGNTATTTISGLAAGTYTFTVTNAAGCTSAASGNVLINSQPAPPATATFTVIQPTCSLGGIITISAPSGAYEYSIDGTAYQASTTFNNVLPGNHTILVRRTPDNTCISPAVTATVNAQPATPPAPVIGTITQPTCALATGSVVLSGLPSGNWTINPGGISDNTATTTISGLAAGTYNFTVTNDAGCTSSASGNVIISSQPVAGAPTVGSITQPTCATATGSVVLSGLPSGNWTINPGAITGNTVTKTISGLSAGTYSFTVTNDAGCISAPTGNVIINSQPSPPPSAAFTITQPTCTTVTGSISIISPAGSYEYSIDNGTYQSSATFNNLTPGNHSVVVRSSPDITCVSAPATVTIDAGPAPTPAPVIGTISQPTCAVATGTVALTGLPNGSWTINPGSVSGNTAATSITGLTPGAYTFTVTDSRGCISAPSGTVVITASSSDLAVTIPSKTNALCKGGSTGSVSVAGSGGIGPYRYRMGTGQYQDSGIFGNLAAGDYTFTVIDGNQCQASVSANISEPEAIAFTYTSEDASCLTTPDGTVTITPSGGTAPYKILWPDGLSAPTRNDLLPGTQKFIISDANGCTSSFEIGISNKENPDCIQIQEILTPNNDGFYDTWKIRNIGMYPDAEVQVFNRWGEKVFSTKNLQANEWDGTYNGKPLPTDSYHFILYLQKGMKPLTGTITIVR